MVDCSLKIVFKLNLFIGYNEFCAVISCLSIQKASKSSKCKKSNL